MKPEKLGNVWVKCEIRFIDDTDINRPVWKTIAKPVDAPNPIKAALAKCRKKHPGKVLWVHSAIDGKYIP